MEEALYNGQEKMEDWTWRNFWDCTTWEFDWEGLVDKGIRLLRRDFGGFGFGDLGLEDGNKPTTRALRLLFAQHGDQDSGASS